MTHTTEQATAGPWELIPDAKGFLNIHHPSEDGRSGDLVATCFQDEAHAALIASAPDLLKIVAIFLGHDDRFQPMVGGNPNAVYAMLEEARAIYARATGAQS